MKLVSENSEKDLARNAASEEVEKTLREFAINFLRVVAGGGRSYEIYGDMVGCIEAAQAYQKVHGLLPSSWDISNAVDGNRADREWMESWSPKDRERFWTNGEATIIDAKMDIRQASLRIVAAQMARQRTIQCNAENLFDAGLRRLDNIREERRRERAEAAKPQRKGARKKKGGGHRQDP
ncbi:hypothetical protein BA190_10350 [Labrys sp. WJW]|uniref:hypothetical protein n=1 Tax=Labrys sp. WJW TaxID=1737983 RepID=UPI000832100F|nr:hypothetical protein [Labrys sp. WJW]OCC05295.1 hypothetical protein BA190_10350 [Labrys sp. WJW]